LQTVVLVMDGSGVGRGCTALMIHVVYKLRIDTLNRKLLENQW
jgi:hypothetical protein